MVNIVILILHMILQEGIIYLIQINIKIYQNIGHVVLLIIMQQHNYGMLEQKN